MSVAVTLGAGGLQRDGEGVRAVVGGGEGVVGGQHRLAVAAGEVDRAGVAGGDVVEGWSVAVTVDRERRARGRRRGRRHLIVRGRGRRARRRTGRRRCRSRAAEGRALPTASVAGALLLVPLSIAGLPAFSV